MATKKWVAEPEFDYEAFRTKMILLAAQEPPEPAETPVSSVTSARSIKLYYTNKSEHSDKVYFMSIIKDTRYKDCCFVNFQYGKRDKTLRDGTKTKIGVSSIEANRIFDAVVAEKKAEGYTENVSGVPFSR